MKPLAVEFPTEPDPAAKTYDIDLIKFKPKYKKALRVEEEQQKGVKYAYSVYLQAEAQVDAGVGGGGGEPGRDRPGQAAPARLHQEGQRAEADDA